MLGDRMALFLRVPTEEENKSGAESAANDDDFRRADLKDRSLIATQHDP